MATNNNTPICTGKVEDREAHQHHNQKQQQRTSSTFPIASGSIPVLASLSGCNVSPMNVASQLKKHARSRSELPSSLPLTLLEQLLRSYSKPKRHVQFTENAQWNPISDAKQQIHPLKRILHEDRNEDISDKVASSQLLAALNDAGTIKMSPTHRRSKTCTLDTVNNINVGGRLMPAEDLLKLEYT